MKILGLLIPLLIIVALVFVFAHLIQNGNMQLFNPQGTIAYQQSQLLFGALILGSCIAFVVLASLFIVVFRYRSGNMHRKYAPDWTGGKFMQLAWWIGPALIIAVLSIVTWVTAHNLDPFKAITSSNKPITIQVVAMRWKWFFIYPDQQIATVNYLEFPTNTPISFDLTADNAPMNSFWIPSLGGQIYAMTGMSTQLHLMASKNGTFEGSAAEISGDGFSGMRFPVKSVSKEDFDMWIAHIKLTAKPLTPTTYSNLIQPSTNNPPAFYSSVENNFYTTIIMKYMEAPGQKIVMPRM